MDRNRKERFSGQMAVIAVIVVVCGFWALLIPHSYKSYRRQTKLAETLQAIKPPAGASVLRIMTSHYATHPYGTGFYTVDSKFDKVKAHYMEEFSRHGFIYKGEDRQDSETSLHFCAPSYNAVLSTVEPEAQPQLYTISIHWKDASC